MVIDSVLAIAFISVPLPLKAEASTLTSHRLYLIFNVPFNPLFLK
jgi:hypothetical protein